MASKGLYADASLRGGPEMLGMSIGAGYGYAGQKAAGEQLPTSSNGGMDHDNPLSPQSAMFWLIAITLAATFGIAGASARVRVLGTRGEVSAGTT